MRAVNGGSVINWSKTLRESPVDWLLERSDPSVRYFALLDLFDRSAKSRVVLDDRKAIPDSLIVRKILKRQNLQGYWEKADTSYQPKYNASYWTVLVLGRLGMTRTDERVARARGKALVL